MHSLSSTRSGRLALLAALAILAAGADPIRPAPKFEGRLIPEPPEQGKPWEPPKTLLPRFLIGATAALFEQGVADPRGCEYRAVEIADGTIEKGRGWVLPERADTPGRFVVGWDGLVYPVVSVGEPLDLGEDVALLVEQIRKSRDDGENRRFRFGTRWGFPGVGRGFNEFIDLSGVGDQSPIKLGLLLRLGRADLAEALFAAGTTWTPAPRARDLTDYHISYLSLANDWAASAFRRLIGAHARGDDAIALDAARKLARFRDLASAKAEAMGFSRPGRNVVGVPSSGPVPTFPLLNQLDDLLRDHERRAAMAPRGPIPRRGGDPAGRVAALIRDLDQIDERQMSSPGAAYPGGSPLVKELIVEGDPAVEPLLRVIESDDRLTRSVDMGRGGSPQRHVHPVYEAAFAALVGILRTREFDDRRMYSYQKPDPVGRKALAASMRQFWEKSRSVPLAERWYRSLLDDSAGPARWLEAAGGVVSPDVPDGEYAKPGTRPMKGEPLRQGKDPSVAALMVRRVGQIKPRGPQVSFPDGALTQACSLARSLNTWDGPASLPILRDLMKLCRDRTDRWRSEGSSNHVDQNLVSSLADFTLARVQLGDLEALDEYADWLRTTSPKMLERQAIETFKPLCAHADRPSLASAARWLFNDPASPWVPLSVGASGTEGNPFQQLFASPLVAVAGFREGLLASLADRTPMGTVEYDGNTTLMDKQKGGRQVNTGSNKPDMEGVPVGEALPYRACDLVAAGLSRLEGSPRCAIYWPEPRRDEAVAACIAYLKRYGGRFSVEPIPGPRQTPFGPVLHLTFPTLDHPATLDDVASARAIFSLEGQGEARVVKLPGLPQEARWVTLKDTPVESTDMKGVITRTYNTGGHVWQVEEVRKGDGWERFYGFVGHRVIARAPASEVEFARDPYSGGPYLWGNLKGGLDARAELVEPRPKGVEPGKPVVVTVQVRNRQGLARSSPTEFLRTSPDGKPALRRGITPSLWRTAKPGPIGGMSQVYPNEEVTPSRDVRFDPGDASRMLEPLESFEAIRLDLADWFDLSKPGQYRFRVAFAADSGLGEGAATEVYFRVGSDE